jgi:hypothetical protein
MTRRRYGAHGKITPWTDDKKRLTIRPQPRAYTVEEVAARLGSYMDVLWVDHPYDDSEHFSYTETIQKIVDFHNGKMPTQQWAIDKLTDIWYMANHEENSEYRIDFDESEPSHMATLDFVKKLFPKFRSTVEHNMAAE